VASLLRGGKYVYSDPESVPVPVTPESAGGEALVHLTTVEKKDAQ